MAEVKVVEHTKIAEIIESVKNWGRVIKTAVLGMAVLLSSYFVPKYTMEHNAPPKAETPAIAAPVAQPAPVVSQPYVAPPVSQPFAAPSQAPYVAPFATSIPTATAASQVSFVVRSTGQSRTGKKFLNSAPNYRDPANQTVVLESGVASGVNEKALVNHMIYATGRSSNYNGKQQIVVEEPGGLTVR